MTVAYDRPPHERLENVRTERDRYRRQRDRAAEMHANDGTGYCSTCINPDYPRIAHLRFPCPTYRALTED